MHPKIETNKNEYAMKKNNTTKKDAYVFAIDIGTTKIVAIVGKKTEKGKIKIIGISKTQSNGVRRGSVLNIEEAVSSIQMAVESAQLKTEIIFSDVYVGIAGQTVRSMRNRAYVNKDNNHTEIYREDVEKLIEDMNRTPIDVGEEILHVIPQSFIVDNETGVKNPIGMYGQRLEGNFHIVVAKTLTTKNIEKCINRVGLQVKDLILEQLASAHAVLTDDEKEAGVAIVDIGGGTTDIAVYYDNVIRHTAVITLGGNAITHDIKEGCKIVLSGAEKLKVQYGSAIGDMASEDKAVTVPGISGREAKEISLRQLAYIIQARMEEIIDSVAYEIDASGYYDKLGAGIVLTGGGSMLKNLTQLVKYKTGLDVKVGHPGENLSVDLHDDIRNPIYSTSVGLILKGFEEDYWEKNIKKKSEESMKKPKISIDFSSTGKVKGYMNKMKNSLNTFFVEDDAEM